MEEAEMVDLLKIPDPSSCLFDLTRKFGSDPPLKRILQIILSQDCHTILIENEYVDEEWASEHNLFYSKIFKKPPLIIDIIPFGVSMPFHAHTTGMGKVTIIGKGNVKNCHQKTCFTPQLPLGTTVFSKRLRKLVSKKVALRCSEIFFQPF